MLGNKSFLPCSTKSKCRVYYTGPFLQELSHRHVNGKLIDLPPVALPPTVLEQTTTRPSCCKIPLIAVERVFRHQMKIKVKRLTSTRPSEMVSFHIVVHIEGFSQPRTFPGQKSRLKWGLQAELAQLVCVRSASQSAKHVRHPRYKWTLSSRWLSTWEGKVLRIC